MPTRIYSAVLTNLSEELSDWEAVAPAYLALAKECAQDPLVGRYAGTQRRIRAKNGLHRAETPPVTFDALLVKYGLASYWSAKNLERQTQGITAGLVGVQLVAKLVTQAFSGMRDDEAKALPYDCLEVVKSNGTQHYVIQGRTTKLNHGQAKRARWVTNQEGYRAIRIAKEIADTVYAVLDATAKGGNSGSGGRVLFANPKYLGITTVRETPKATSPSTARASCAGSRRVS